MLKFKLNADGVLEVMEYTMSAKSSKVTYWYYNLRAWIKSVQGKKDEMPTQMMTQAQIDWVRKHYVPKVENDIKAYPDLAMALLVF